MSSSVPRPSVATRGPRTIALIILGVVAVAVGLVVLGRWERSNWVDEQLRGMQRTRALVGPLDQSELSGYRVEPGFQCLVYRRGFNPYALELCVEPTGRLVETIDRRTSTRDIASLRADPEAATIQLPRAEVDRLLRRMHAHAALE